MQKKISHKKKVPYIGQLQATECGLCCAAMILHYYKSYETISELRKDYEIGRDGLKLKHLKSILENKGFHTKLYEAKIEDLSSLEFPMILFWDHKHYVVCESIKKKIVNIMDPAIGRIKYTLEEAAEHFSGYLLEIKPTASFQRKKKEVGTWKIYLEMIGEKKKEFARLLFLASITYFITLLVPILIQNIVDMVTNNNISSFNPFKLFIVVSFIVLIYGASTYYTGKRQIDFSFFLDKKMNYTIFQHLLELPYKFFETRSHSDLAFRIQSLAMIRELLSRRLIDFIINIGALIVIAVYMLYKSVLLSFVALGLFFINGFVMAITRKKILESNQCEIVENSKLQSTQMEIIYSILGIKVSATEKVIFKKWEQQYDVAMRKRKTTQSYQNIHNTVIGVVKMMTPLIVLCIGINLVIRLELTIGELIGFYSIVNILSGLGLTIFQTWDSFLLATQYLERVRDILDEEKEKSGSIESKNEIKGCIELKNVSFSYTNLSDSVLKNISLKIKAGETIAIVGASGSGKTTLSKILLGLYEPTDGEICYDNINFCNINKKYLRKQMGVVPQELSLLNKTIYENIEMNRTNISQNDIKLAAQYAQIDNEIMSMPMGYNTLISDMGSNLSGGQRQRIALARAMASFPKIMILDEATSSLDAINEQKVSEILKKMGCTRIIIAHRLSTIKEADQILVMDKGTIIEEGTHKELIEKKGAYFALYKNSVELPKNLKG